MHVYCCKDVLFVFFGGGGKRHNRVYPGQNATQQGTYLLQRETDTAGWSTPTFTLPCSKNGGVYPATSTFLQNCTPIFRNINARTDVRMGEEDCKVIGAYGRDTRVSDSNGTSLLRFAGDNKLALVNTIFSVPKGCTSRTFNGTRPADRKRIDYVITRQSHRKLVRNVTVHLQPYADSDHNIVCARVRLPGRFARHRKQRAPTGRKSIDRRAITSDTDRRERLIQLVAIQLTQTELGGTVGEQAALFTDTLLRSAEEVMPG